MGDLFQMVRKIVADVLGIDETIIAEKFSYRDTDRWDSLKHMEIITAIEQSFSVTLTAADIVMMTSIPDIVGILSQKTGK
jgi:acyl carrier protein